MVKRCFVANCQSNRKTEKASLFKAPNDAILLEEWRKIVPARDRELTSKDRICEKHFEKRYVIPRYQQSKYGDFYEDHIRPKLTPNAIPTIFNEESKGKASSKPTELNYNMLQTNTFKCFLSDVKVSENDIVPICYNCLLGKCKTHSIICY